MFWLQVTNWSRLWLNCFCSVWVACLTLRTSTVQPKWEKKVVSNALPRALDVNAPT